MNVVVVNDYDEMSKRAASIIASQVILNPKSVLGFATGDTPIGTYKELVKIYKEGYIDFSDVVTFNLDEYYSISKENPQSYNFYMKNYLFNHINVKDENIHMLNGMCDDIEKECTSYENLIKESGGINLQILGIGRNGHIGFNEPNANFEGVTHLVHLDKGTINANSRFFNSVEEVPTKAISMGIKTIMSVKKILLLASGIKKSEAVYHAVNGPITPKVPGSILQLHPDVTLLLDKEAAYKISSRNEKYRNLSIVEGKK